MLVLPVLGKAEPPLVLQHKMRIMPDVTAGTLQIEDTLQLPATALTAGKVEMMLDSSFAITSTKPTLALKPLALGRYSIALPPNQREITLQYQGKLASTPECAWLTQDCLLLSEQGLFLDANSHWYPQIPGVLHTFDLQITLPKDWVSLGQGEQTAQGWRENNPQNSIYLIAGKFHVYQQDSKPVSVQVYLREPDEALAKRYLQTAQTYLDMYSTLLGPYPYTKFATVESFWQTGWGMPSFTLLGSQVMRLPFILQSSFPHEILHNWWGNSVYVDVSQGNWSEGLTAYLADYRIKEQQGQGSEYRRSALQKYTTFVGEHADMPLAEFRSRHNDTTQAIGYDKSLMLFHMLRRQLGDEAFFKGLQTFYQQYRFHWATFGDLLAALNADKAFQSMWVNSPGAPQLKISAAHMQPVANGFELSFTLQQTQSGKPFTLDIPIQVKLRDASKAPYQQTVHMTQATQQFTLSIADRPAQLAIDPDFDVFRLPNPAEIPASVGVLFGKGNKTFVIARKASPAMQETWETWVQALQARDSTIRLQYDDEPLPTIGTLILLGGDNVAHEWLAENLQQPRDMDEITSTINEIKYVCGAHTLAIAVRAQQRDVIIMDALTPVGWSLLLRKLPHYGKYSYLVFDSNSGENIAKGQWEVTNSPLTLPLP